LEKLIRIKRCCDCGFNEHGQAPWFQLFDTYLGYTINAWDLAGGPMLFCMYDPKEDFRQNLRMVTHGWGENKHTICVIGEPEFEGEFEKQLKGFPDWCPLESEKDAKVVNIRNISKEDAKKEIIELLETGKTFYPSEISEGLEIDYEMVWEILKEFDEEAKIITGD
jgi:hypothetical protein